jgi:hypothetical protein
MAFALGHGHRPKRVCGTDLIDYDFAGALVSAAVASAIVVAGFAGAAVQ